MPDVFTKAKRSAVMALIRSRGNKDTEIVLARLLRAHKITGWRRHLQIRISSPATRRSSPPPLSVRPDFVFSKQKLAIFVDGCFWHGCPRHGTKPRGNRVFWQKKFATNLARDLRVNRALRSANWRVLRIWEHELKHETRLLRRLAANLPLFIQR